MIKFIDFLNKNDLKEGKTALDWVYRYKSILSGLTRKIRVGKEDAAFIERPAKSPAFKPRKQKDPSSKINATLLNQEYDHNTINEGYDSFNIVKPAGYGTFLTAKDLGIKIKAGFEHHPSVEEAIEEIEEKKNDKATNKKNNCSN